jgi:hypothetical protein
MYDLIRAEASNRHPGAPSRLCNACVRALDGMRVRDGGHTNTDGGMLVFTSKTYGCNLTLILGFQPQVPEDVRKAILQIYPAGMFLFFFFCCCCSQCRPIDMQTVKRRTGKYIYYKNECGFTLNLGQYHTSIFNLGDLESSCGSSN